MAKENFDRSKPFLLPAEIIEDTSGQLTVGLEELLPDAVSLSMSAPTSGSVESAIVGLPFDQEFFFQPALNRPATTIDYQIFLLPSELQGVTDPYVTFALRQDQQVFLGTRHLPLSLDSSWLGFSDSGLEADDFLTLDGRIAPDFSQPFQFGFAFGAEYSTAGAQVEVGIADMHVSVFSVPEPSSIMLVASMGVTLLLHRWWRG